MKNKIIIAMRTLLYFMIILAFLLVSISLGFHLAIVALVAIFSAKFDIQLFLLLLAVVSVLVVFVWVVSSKLKNKFKILLLIFLLLFQILCFKCSFFIPTVNEVVNIKNCIELGQVWDDVSGSCSIKKDAK